MPVNRKSRNEFGAIHIFLGLLLGFILGSTLVYWHSNRQNDRVISETIDKVMAMFAGQTIQLKPGDSIIVVKERTDTLKLEPAKETPVRRQTIPRPESQIAQDRLLFARTLTFSVSDTISDLTKRLDSLVGNYNQSSREQLFVIEFWESPLNSVGYRMGKNKLALYGIKAYDLVSLAEHKGKTYLRYINEYYPIEHTTTFKPLIPVNDPFTIDEHGQY